MLFPRRQLHRTSPAGAAVRAEIAGGTEMEKVSGIGGFFFRSKDPKALALWYENTWASRNPRGSKSQERLLSLLSLRPATISEMPTNPGC